MNWRTGPALATLVFAALFAACSSSNSGGTTPSATAPATSTTVAASPSPAPSATPTAVTAAVPASYQGTYSELETALAGFEKTLPAAPAFGDVGVVSTSLITANSNSGPALLRPAVLDTTKAYLDDMAKLGSKGVEIQVSYPVGSAEFPNQAAYIAFYKQVVAEAHQRGFTVLIETSAIFANSPFTDIQFDFSKLTAETYFAARTAEIVTIAKQVGPDYLAIGEEPVNERVFAGIDYTPDQYVTFVNAAAAAVRTALGPNSTTKVGVGTGTWEFSLYQQFIKQTDLDFYDIHIYPLQGNPGGLQTAAAMAKLAADKGKPAIIGETWLYKMGAGEASPTPGASAPEAFRRDAFSFWEPLDERYIRDVLALGAQFKMPFVSFWGARFMFGQLDWTPDLDALDFRGISSQINPLLSQNINAGATNNLGDAFRRLLATR